MPARLPLLLLATSLALTACGREDPASRAEPPRDPAVVAALADPIMIDPDLASQNRGNAAIALDTFDAVPLDDVSPETVEDAQAEAARLAGGMVRTAPQAVADGAKLAPALTAGQVAASLPASPAGCLEHLRYGYGWAAAMPAALPIYPRGHVREAAGNDACRLRAVIFVTPVEPSDIIDFYHTRAEDAGYAAERRRHGDVDVLGGTKGGAAFVVRVRRAGSLSEVELAVRG